MAIFTGTAASERIRPEQVDASVAADPPGAAPGGLADTLFGGGGADILDGGAGADRMFGGSGVDVYYVDDAGDVIEDVEEGPVYRYNRPSEDDYYFFLDDLAHAGVSYRLGRFVERLYLTGSADLDGTGNAIGNLIRGNDGANRLRGLGGEDGLFGFGGADVLEGGAGADLLDGGTGADVMSGGAGDDLYYLDSASDVVLEGEDGGTDTVNLAAGVSWTLAANLENLEFGYGAGDVDGTGNTRDNALYGSAGDNVLSGLGGADSLEGGVGADALDGGAGADVMSGGAGDDFYYVGASADRVLEASSGAYGGSDTVYATASFTLTDFVERLALVGARATSGTGNAESNAIFGNGAANVLRGMGGADVFRSGGGADVLAGGTGADLFQYLGAVGSTPEARDMLRAGDGAAAFEGAGAAEGDRFDLSRIDADETRAGVQDFVFGTATGRGRLWAATSGSNTLIRGNTDGDAAAEFEVAIEDGTVSASAYSAADFLL